MDTQKISEIIEKITDTAAYAAEICKEAWAQPHAPEMLGIAAAIAVLLTVFGKIRRHFKPIKLFNNRAGEVEVSRKALDELVQSVCYSLGALNRPSVKIFLKRGKLCMTVALKLESGQTLTSATGEIQQALTTAFREHLGVEKLGKIDVRVIGFKGLIYKPANKFLPPVKDETPDAVFDESNPVIDIVDTSNK